jgi:hypothetical protein
MQRTQKQMQTQTSSAEACPHFINVRAGGQEAIARASPARAYVTDGQTTVRGRTAGAARAPTTPASPAP